MDINIKEEELKQWRAKFPTQAALFEHNVNNMKSLTVDVVNRQNNEKYVLIHTPNHALLEDFEYLVIFNPIRKLTIKDMYQSGTQMVPIGCNLHKLTNLTSLFIHYDVSSFHEDFGMFTPQLINLNIEGKVDLKKTQWEFPKLNTLRVGKIGHVSTTDFKWCKGTPSLRWLVIESANLTTLKISSISPNLTTLKITDCDMSDASMFSDLINLKTLHLVNANVTKFPYFVSKWKNLTELILSNKITNARFKNRFDDAIVLDSSFHRFVKIDLSGTHVKKFVINNAVNPKKFELSTLYLHSFNFEEGAQPSNNLSFNDPNRMIDELLKVSVSGSIFPEELLNQTHISDYVGGYKLKPEWETRTNGNWIGFDADDFDFAIDDEETRIMIYDNLKQANPNVAFRGSMMDGETTEESEVFTEWTSEEIEEQRLLEEEAYQLREQRSTNLYAEHAKRHRRKTPYFNIYSDNDRAKFGIDPFDPASGAQCQLCFDLFVREEHIPTSVTSTDFLLEDGVPYNRTVVFCNLTDHDAESMRDSGETNEDRIAAHHKPDHLFHLDCFQQSMRSYVFRDQAPQCPINRDPFSHD